MCPPAVSSAGATRGRRGVTGPPLQRFRALVYWEGFESDPFVIDLVTAADAEEARQLVSTMMMRTYWRWRGEPVRIVVVRA